MRAAIVSFTALALGAMTAPALASTSPAQVFGETTSRVTVSVTGAESRDVFVSGGPAISRHGRFVAFSASATDLVPGAEPKYGGIYVRDRLAGRTFVASVSGSGAFPSSPGTYEPVISASGRYVAFTSYAPNLVARDTNRTPDVFVRDTVAGRTLRVSVTSTGAQSSGYSQRPSISADGRYVAFESSDALVPMDRNDHGDVYLHDLSTGATTLVSDRYTGAGQQIRGTSPAISGDGRSVVYTATGPDRVSNVYLYDVPSGRTTAVTRFTGPQPGEGTEVSGTVSFTGRYVVLVSGISPAGGTGQAQVYRWDRTTGRAVLVSSTPAGRPGNGRSFSASISAAGDRVAFSSEARDLLAGVRPTTNEIYVRDLVADVTKIASVTPDGDPANGGGDANINGSVAPSLSADGRHVAFLSGATNLFGSPEQRTGPEVFARDTATGG